MCLFKAITKDLVSRSQILILLSEDADAMNLLSFENLTSLTLLLYTYNYLIMLNS